MRRSWCGGLRRSLEIQCKEESDKVETRKKLSAGELSNVFSVELVDVLHMQTVLQKIAFLKGNCRQVFPLIPCFLLLKCSRRRGKENVERQEIDR